MEPGFCVLHDPAGRPARAVLQHRLHFMPRAADPWQFAIVAATSDAVAPFGKQSLRHLHGLVTAGEDGMSPLEPVAASCKYAGSTLILHLPFCWRGELSDPFPPEWPCHRAGFTGGAPTTYLALVCPLQRKILRRLRKTNFVLHVSVKNISRCHVFIFLACLYYLFILFSNTNIPSPPSPINSSLPL